MLVSSRALPALVLFVAVVFSSTTTSMAPSTTSTCSIAQLYLLEIVLHFISVFVCLIMIVKMLSLLVTWFMVCVLPLRVPLLGFPHIHVSSSTLEDFPIDLMTTFARFSPPDDLAAVSLGTPRL